MFYRKFQLLSWLERCPTYRAACENNFLSTSDKTNTRTLCNLERSPETKPVFSPCSTTSSSLKSITLDCWMCTECVCVLCDVTVCFCDVTKVALQRPLFFCFISGKFRPSHVPAAELAAVLEACNPEKSEFLEILVVRHYFCSFCGHNYCKTFCVSTLVSGKMFCWKKYFGFPQTT